MRLIYNLSLLLSQDTTQQDKVAERVERDEGTDAFTSGMGDAFQLAANGSKTINLPSANQGMLYIQADQPLNVVVNGAAAPLVLTPRTKMNATDNSTNPGVLFMLADGISSLEVSNPSGSNPVNVVMGTAGL